MGELSTVSVGQYRPGESLEAKLDYLAKYGRPRIGMSNDGTWYCNIEMFVSGEGVSFDIKSGFDHTSPGKAADVVIERVDKALRDLTK